MRELFRCYCIKAAKLPQYWRDKFANWSVTFYLNSARWVPYPVTKVVLGDLDSRRFFNTGPKESKSWYIAVLAKGVWSKIVHVIMN